MQLKPVHQTLFGNIEAAPEERGNCFPACVASILGIPLAAVPHFYGPDGPSNDGAECWEKVLDWLQARGWTAFGWEWPLHEGWHRALSGAVVIVSGASPRFANSQHAVVGQLDGRGGWRLVHDPHPEGSGIAGEPTFVELVLPLVQPPESMQEAA